MPEIEIKPFLKKCEFKELDYKKYKINTTENNKKDNANKKEIFAFDTETYQGYASIICCSNGKYALIEKFYDFINFLDFEMMNDKKSINFFFNLDYDFFGLVKHMSKEERLCKSLILLIRFNSCTIPSYDGNPNIHFQLEYIPKKSFSITQIQYIEGNNKHKYKKITFFDILNYFQNFGSLEKTYNKVFQNQNKTYKKRLSAKDGFSIEDIKKNPEIIQYCYEDAYSTYEIAKAYVEEIQNTLHFIPKKFYSPASIAKEYIQHILNSKNQALVKTINYSKRNKLQEYGYYSYSGGRFEILIKGKIENAYMYDINSAYPYAISQLKMMNGITKYENNIRDDALYSFFEVEVYTKRGYENNIISPLKCYVDRILAFPFGNFKCYIAEPELKVIEKYMDKSDIRIIKGIHLIDECKDPNAKENRPFRFVEEIYRLRKKEHVVEGKTLQNYIYKQILNSLYGNFIQITKKYNIFNYQDIYGNVKDISDFLFSVYGNFSLFCPKCEMLYFTAKYMNCEICRHPLMYIEPKPKYVIGELFNPAIASYITSSIRAKLFHDSVIQNDENKIVMYATDSITSTEKLSHIEISNDLGAYSVKEKLNGVVIGSGIYSLENDQKRINAFRTFDKRTNIQEIIQANQEVDEIKIIKTRPKKIKECKKSFDEINIFKPAEKTLSLLIKDKKRIWLKTPKKFKDILENTFFSKPLVV